ncbi:hypothetical protein GCM10017783_21980 [Deinococcus piscis]|uniref:Lipoprotein n=1 Tax=Deinococcus piscis TaxID=394230 RepID=A0ABQ3K9H9_9DEIO|nr:hypothetical protein [Deinococcus piscis]GHG08933.1 hypothetical protein GCM10017783_21980 [Deinococcus piscis]
MKKMIFALGTLTLALTACGGGNPAPQPAPAPPPKPTVTLYQGVWGYAYDQNYDGIIEEGGVAAFVDEFQGNFGRVAAGAYSNEAETRQGGALLGPIAGTGHLEAFFTADLSENVKPYLIAADADNQLGTYQGYPVFEGGAVTTDTAGNLLSEGLFVMVQVSTDKPASLEAQAALQEEANRLAAQRLSSSVLSAQAQHPRPDFAGLQLNGAELLRR